MPGLEKNKKQEFRDEREKRKMRNNIYIYNTRLRANSFVRPAGVRVESKRNKTVACASTGYTKSEYSTSALARASQFWARGKHGGVSHRLTRGAFASKHKTKQKTSLVKFRFLVFWSNGGLEHRRPLFLPVASFSARYMACQPKFDSKILIDRSSQRSRSGCLETGGSHMCE